jgi:hypothetical protein
MFSSETFHNFQTAQPENSARQWRRQPFKSGGDFRAVKARDTSRGVRGHAPPENFWNLESLKYDFLHFQGKIIQNSENYKVKKHTIFHDYTYI